MVDSGVVSETGGKQKHTNSFHGCIKNSNHDCTDLPSFSDAMMIRAHSSYYHCDSHLAIGLARSKKMSPGIIEMLLHMHSRLRAQLSVRLSIFPTYGDNSLLCIEACKSCVDMLRAPQRCANEGPSCFAAACRNDLWTDTYQELLRFFIMRYSGFTCTILRDTQHIAKSLINDSSWEKSPAPGDVFSLTADALNTASSARDWGWSMMSKKDDATQFSDLRICSNTVYCDDWMQFLVVHKAAYWLHSDRPSWVSSNSCPHFSHSEKLLAWQISNS